MVATIAETAKQLHLSKKIQVDAFEMVRRAERGVGKVIRKGQTDGTVRKQKDNPYTDRVGDTESIKIKPTDLAPQYELSGNPRQPGIYDLTDGVSDEQFEEAIAEAKAEGDMSRRTLSARQNMSPVLLVTGLRESWDFLGLATTT